MALPFADCSARRLDEIVQDRLLCVFAFDGTLAPPERMGAEGSGQKSGQKRVPLGLLLRLRALASYAPVALISDQPLPDVRARLEFEPDFLIGSHGVDAPNAAVLCADGFRPSFSDTSRRGLYMAGKSVLKMVPPSRPGMGAALEQLMRNSGADSAIYVGDETADEDVFGLRRSDVLTVRIGMAASTRAEFFLPQRLDVFQVLDKLIARLREAQSRNWLHREPATPQYYAALG